MLRITSDLRHYALGAKDGHTGSVEDFYFDDEEWIISYVVAGTDTWLEDRLRILSLMTGPGRFTTSSSTPGNWWHGKKIVISPEWIQNVSWTDSTVYADLTRGAIKNAPEYDPSRPIDRDYERRLHQHYGGKVTGSNSYGGLKQALNTLAG